MGRQSQTTTAAETTDVKPIHQPNTYINSTPIQVQRLESISFIFESFDKTEKQPSNCQQ